MKRALLLIIVALAVGALAPTAHAAMKLRLNDGVNPALIVADNGAGDLDPTVGVVTYLGSLGAWKINVTSGTSKPVIGGATIANLDLLSGVLTSKNSAGGTITVELTDTDYVLPAHWSMVQVYSDIGGTTDGTVLLTQRYDPDNSEFAVTTPGNDTVLNSPPQSGGSFSDAQMAWAALVNPFSLSEKVVVTHGASGDQGLITTFDAESTVVPVPGAVLLGILGLSAAGIRLRKFA